MTAAPAPPVPRPRPARWQAIACAAALFYLVSFGPLVFMLRSLGAGGEAGQGAIRWIALLYAPHVWLQEHTRPYYEYARWWNRLARPDVAILPWEAWVQLRDSGQAPAQPAP